MGFIENIQVWLQELSLPILLIVGVMTMLGLFAGRSIRHLRLPSIIGFMMVGVIMGPSLLNILNSNVQEHLAFITELALGFVALSIGLELSFRNLRGQGMGMIYIIMCESLLAFGVVSAGIYMVTGSLPLALIFGAVAPASAPAGTVAIIQEYRSRGSLTNALYTVVGFDDGLGIIIFGFTFAFVSNLIAPGAQGQSGELGSLILAPLREIGLSIGVGGVVSVIFCYLARKLTSARDIFVLLFSSVLISVGISTRLHFSLILTNMVLGIVAVNTQPRNFIQKIRDELTEIMPLLFVLFFVLAGANLHISVLPSLGIIGLVYMVCRITGLMGGAWIGATIGKAESKIRKYLGMGILSQAGVAIGLALIVKHHFSQLGDEGAGIGSIVITSVTATSIIFEVIGPVLTKIGLSKAGEISSP
ncbi:MAG: cation:proton antiporter [Spirochaetota bacterium]